LHSGDELNVVVVREKIMNSILEVNPLLSPDKLYINRNDVIKFKGRKKLEENEILLTKNTRWSYSYYEDTGFGTSLVDKIVPDGEDKDKKPKKKTKEDIDSLSYKKKSVWWDRINQYITVRQYSNGNAEYILKNKSFYSKNSFYTYIVSQVVEDFEDLFALVDNLGIAATHGAPKLMSELYELCKQVNPSLTFENAQELQDGELEDKPENDGVKQAYPGAQTVHKKSKLRFKDVEKEDLLNLADSMKLFLVGQDEAIKRLSDSIQRASIGLKDPDRPIGSFLFAGRTGVGKTLATKILANNLIKRKDNLVTVDCSEYSADHEYSKLIGAPSGYVGHEQGGFLTNAIAKHPFSVIVFDEVEKASHKVHELMLQILEEGRLTDGRGKTVSFKETIVIMTSNVGVNEIEAIGKAIGFGDASVLTDVKKDAALGEALKKIFKPEFLNRIDEIVNFRMLTKKDYIRIIDIELFKLVNNLKNNNTDYSSLELIFDDKLKKLIYKKGIKEEYGARPLKRCIERLISTPLAQKILEEGIDPESRVSTTVVRARVKFLIEEKIDEAPFYLNAGEGK
jgi:ATP-dependent Clp protease ATP-binding subunit ClpC